MRVRITGEVHSDHEEEEDGSHEEREKRRAAMRSSIKKEEVGQHWFSFSIIKEEAPAESSGPVRTD